MDVFLVTHVTGETVIDYGSYPITIGVYTTKRKAMKARAAYAEYHGLIDDNNYNRLLKSGRQIFHLAIGSLHIKKIEADKIPE